MFPSRPPYRTLRARLVGPTRRIARPFSPRAWQGLVEWVHDASDAVDVEIRSLSPLRNRLCETLEIDFHAAPGPPARWRPGTSLDHALDAFVHGVAAPSCVRGMVGVDLADYAHGLQGRDMQIRLLHGFPSKLLTTFYDARDRWGLARPAKFVALHVCTSTAVSAAELIDACVPDAEALAPEGDIIWAATTNQQGVYAGRALIAVVLAA